MKWAGAIGAAVAGLLLAWTGGSFFLNGGFSAMDSVPWGFVLMIALMISMAVAGISLFRAPNNTAMFVFFASAIMGSPLVLMWVAFSFGD
jgi:FtsH-binding integral membrane protein